jgi:hypothetical protein
MTAREGREKAKETDAVCFRDQYSVMGGQPRSGQASVPDKVEG